MSKQGSENRARKYTLSCRTTLEEKTAIKRRARAYGLSVGGYIREIALDKPLPSFTRFSKDDGQFVACVLASLARMMDHLRALEQDRSQGDRQADLAHELMRLRDHCFAVMGRRP